MGSWVLEEGWRKGPWTDKEDKLLIEYVKLHGQGRWNNVSRVAGLRRNGKSCRLRWVNYLRPGLKRGEITPEEKSVILELHARWGNRWSRIARNLPGRTDNEIKNYCRTLFKKRTNLEKSRVSFLRRQRFQQQRYQHNQMDGKGRESDKKKLIMVPSASDNSYPYCLPCQQGFAYPMIDGCETSPQPSSSEYNTIMWNLDGLLSGDFMDIAGLLQ